jgi:hypothetical protein
MQHEGASFLINQRRLDVWRGATTKMETAFVRQDAPADIVRVGCVYD